MPLTTKTFSQTSEAAAALSSDRGARYLGGGTLVMRALNEGDLAISTLVRATDRALGRIDFASSRVTLGAGVTLARIVAERELAFLHPVARSIGGPAVRNMGTVGGNLFAPAPFGDLSVALLALDAMVSVQSGFGARDMGLAAQFKQGKTISGRGIFLAPLSAVDTETGEMSPATCYAHACFVAEVEVDDETGEVGMVRMDSAYELGRALNPRLVEQQLVGGAWMGVSHALFETTEPYYPDPSRGPRDFTEYLMPGPGDICPHDIAVLERPAADGPFGAKGPGEMCANPVLPAVANAIFNAVGVRIDDLPITPEKVLRAIRAQGGAKPRARR